MIRYIIIILCMLSFLIIGYSCNYSNEHSKAEAKLNKLIKKKSIKLANKYGSSISSYGGGKREGKKWLITVFFNRRGGPVSKEKGRKMIIDCIEEFLSAINADEEIRPVLKNYPFTSENLDIAIINYQKDGSTLLDPDIQIFANSCGKIFYYTQDPDDKYKYKSKTSEPYEDALAIVRKEQQQALIDREL